MEIISEELVHARPVTVLRLKGDLDASSFKNVIAAGRQAYNNGARGLLLDLSGVGFMSSSGLVALHSLALIMRGETTPNLDEGWSAMHAVAEYVDSSSGPEANFKLLKPGPRIQQTLSKTGFSQTFAVFDDEAAALASFS